MLIALDYDNTYSTDPTNWKAFVKQMQQYGYTFICATSRPKTAENKRILGCSIGEFMPIIFCNHEPKKRICDRLGYPVDIWIDDRPQTIPVAARQSYSYHKKGCTSTTAYFHE